MKGCTANQSIICNLQQLSFYDKNVVNKVLIVVRTTVWFSKN